MNLLVASGSQYKLKEYRQLLKGVKLTLCDLKVAETGTTFTENAVIKARACGRATGKLAIGDDSGLEIKALNGFPGIRSARYARGDFKAAMERILDRLKGKTRRARFVCAIALYLPESGRVKTFSGVVSGRISLRPFGRGGFGYDPIFYLPGLKKTFGQLGLREKSRLSHRGKAARKLQAFLKATGRR